MEASGSFTPRSFYIQGYSPGYSLDRRLGGPQSRSGHGVKVKNSQLPPGIELRSSRMYVRYGKGKVVPVLLTEYHSMKEYWGVEIQLHVFFDLGTRLR
jgi:hypothetical protein